MRISAGSRRLSRNGGNIYVHPEIPFITIRPTIRNPISQSVQLAPLEIRHAVFQELIRISPASNYMENLSPAQAGCCHADSLRKTPRVMKWRLRVKIIGDYPTLILD